MLSRRHTNLLIWLTCAAIALLLGVSSLLTPRAGLADTVPDGFTSTVFATGLSSPTTMAFAPDGRLFVCEQGGRLRVVKNGTLLPQPFVQLTVDPSGERGLLGVTFDPLFPEEPYVYLYYTVPGNPPHNRVSRFTANGDVAVPGSEVVLLELNNLNATNHNGGALHFGPDGYLYVAVGENAVPANAQSLNNLLGKILRMGRDGSTPPDNPFLASTTGKNRLIWARGLRNPFTFAFQPGTGRMFINDVGNMTWEEVDLGAAGANYGWPTQEGPVGPNNPAFTRPIFWYSHNDPVLRGCSITGAAFYNPPVPRFPQQFVGRYFFADFCGSYIASFDPDNPGAGASIFATGVNTPVDVRVGPDGALYYLSRGFSGAEDKVFRIDYTAESPPLIAANPTDQTVTVGQPASFSVGATGTTPLSYQWQRNGINIPGAVAQEYTLPSPTLADNGAKFRVRVRNAFGEAFSEEATLTVVTNTPPVASIQTPAAGSFYSAGSTISFSGAGNDPEEGSLPASAFTWWIDFHHDQHFHPAMPETSGSKTGSYVVPTSGETSPNVWYRIHLRVTDSGGLTHEVFRDVMPRKSTVTLQTSPPGLELTLDGQPVSTPHQFTGVVGIVRSIGAAQSQSSGGNTLQFEGWSDGGARVHNITTPDASTTYTATYAPSGTPTNLAAQALSGVRVRLTWTDTASSETGFRIERRTGASDWSGVGQAGANTSTWEDVAVSPQTAYTYRVRAVVNGLQTLPSNEASVTTPRSGRLALAPPRLNFGRVRRGRARVLALILRNTGRGPLPVTVGEAGGAFTVLNGGSFTLPPGRQRSVRVRFAPTAAGPVSAKIAIQSDDPARRDVSYQLAGRGQ